MKRMTEEEYLARFRKLRSNNIQKLRRRKLWQERFRLYPKIKMPSTSKLVLLGVFLICIEVLVFSQYAMIVLGDASALYALIGVPAALIPVCLGYYSKAKAENTVGGIKYDSVVNSNTGSEEDAVG